MAYARLDVLEVAQAVLQEAGMPFVGLSMQDARAFQEAAIITPGTPLPGKRYFDGSGTSVLRLTVIVRRADEERGLRDAQECARALNRDGAMASRNGSYRLVRCDADNPRLLQLDATGRYVCVLDCQVEYEDLI